MYIGIAQAIVTIASPLRILIFRNEHSPVALLILFKIIEQLGTLIYLIAYAYDENDTDCLKNLFTCSKPERTQTLDEKMKEELVTTKA